MKALGIGLDKTGTTSLCKVFRRLGYNSIHCPMTYEEMVEHEAATGPCAVWNYRRVWDEFPDCKFVLTLRDLNEWLTSSEHHFRRTATTEEFRRWRIKIYGTDLWRSWESRTRLAQVYSEHRKTVDKFFSFQGQDRLLTVVVPPIDEPGTWRILCDFLNKPLVEGEPFPHFNAIDPKVRAAKEVLGLCESGSPRMECACASCVRARNPEVKKA